MLYYKANNSMYLDKYPYSIPKHSLLTESEIHRYRLDDIKDIHFTAVNIKRSNTEKLWYDFRYEKGVKN